MENLNSILVREAMVSGGFYPSDSKTLKDELNNFLKSAERFTDEPLFGLISPHAGYKYSGPVAGWAYRQIEHRKYNTAIVIAPSHYEAFPFSAVLSGGGYMTPLGLIEVDIELANFLIESGDDNIVASQKGHTVSKGRYAEHSLEVQLPFLQVVLGNFRLVPVVMGRGGWDQAKSLGDAISKVYQSQDILVIASSDLSHFHNYEEAYAIDLEVIKHIEEMDCENLAIGCRDGWLEACGGAPIAALMHAAKLSGYNTPIILQHKSSGDISGSPKDQVVGYLSAAIVE